MRARKRREKPRRPTTGNRRGVLILANRLAASTDSAEQRRLKENSCV
jgi:hypothetical protein